MSPALLLAWRTLVRRPRRLALFVAGIAVATAMLLDMVMLSSGLQRSLARLLEATGYPVRATPTGLLPFETEAVIPGADALAAAFAADPRVSEAVPVWAQTLYVRSADRAGAEPAVAVFGMGVPLGTAPALRIRDGHTLARDDEAVTSASLAERLRLEPGERITVGLDPDPAVGAARNERILRVTAIADFVFAPRAGLNLALSLETLRAMADAPAGAASLVLVRVAPGADPYAVARDFRARTAEADVFAIPEIIEAAGGRLTYFRRLSLVLGVVSLGVTFLLITTLLTLSVNDRWGEIATLRALGVTRPHLLVQVGAQGLLLCGGGALAGLGIGWVVSRYLDALLRAFPGLPAGVSFFVFTPRDGAICVALVLVTGLVAGLYPAWRAASVEIAGALRAEMA